MRTIEIQAYKFNELDEQTKLQVIEDNLYINVEHDWWDFTYETLRECGIKVNSFDIGRRQECEIEFSEDCFDVATNIINMFGEKMIMVNYAKNFIKDRNSLAKKDWEAFDEQQDNLIHKFKAELSCEILYWLKQDYEHLTSEQSIYETIEASEYEFTKEGKLI